MNTIESVISGLNHYMLHEAGATQQKDGKRQSAASFLFWKRCRFLDMDLQKAKLPSCNLGFVADFIYLSKIACVMKQLAQNAIASFTSDFSWTEKSVQHIFSALDTAECFLDRLIDHANPLVNTAYLAGSVAMISLGLSIPGWIGIASLSMIALKSSQNLPFIVGELLEPIAVLASIYGGFTLPISFFMKSLHILGAAILTANYVSSRHYLTDRLPLKFLKEAPGVFVVNEDKSLAIALEKRASLFEIISNPSHFQINQSAIHATEPGRVISLEETEKLNLISSQELYKKIEDRCESISSDIVKQKKENQWTFSISKKALSSLACEKLDFLQQTAAEDATCFLDEDGNLVFENEEEEQVIDADLLEQLLGSQLKSNEFSLQEEGEFLLFKGVGEGKCLGVENFRNEEGWSAIKMAVMQQRTRALSPSNFERFSNYLKRFLFLLLQEKDPKQFVLKTKELSETGDQCEIGWVGKTRLLLYPQEKEIKQCIHRKLAEFRSSLLTEEIRTFVKKRPELSKFAGGENNVCFVDQIHRTFWHRWRTAQGEDDVHLNERSPLTTCLQIPQKEYSFLREALLLFCNTGLIAFSDSIKKLVKIGNSLHEKYLPQEVETVIFEAIKPDESALLQGEVLRDIQWDPTIVAWIADLATRKEGAFDIRKPDGHYDEKWVASISVYNAEPIYYLTQEGVRLLLWDLGILERK